MLTTMIKRAIESELLQSAKEYPVVTIIGPRQAGKTTLAKMCFPSYQYVTLEDPNTRQLAQDDPQAFFSQITSNAIIDEIQRVPQLLSYIQVIVDEHKKNGEFILTGSHQLERRQSVTQSLAGRTAILKLLPLSISELEDLSPRNTYEQIFKGFLPRIYDQDQDPTRAYRNYYDTYVQRDVTQLINVKNQNSFERFIQLLAGRVGQIVNYHSLASDVGVSSNTIKEWLSILEASFIIFRL
ncbi:MAG: ATP-binding protein, partial [Bacteriovoracaceae bacterium]|nr:ATP-binding protein [Bacteriovoracaceae bacterium]